MTYHPEAVALPVTLNRVYWKDASDKTVVGTVRAMWLVTDRKPPSSSECSREFPVVHLLVERADSQALVTVAAEKVRTCE